MDQSANARVENMHSTSTLTVSRFRQKPASSIVKPACIPNTRKAPSRTQAVFSGLMMSPAFAVLYGSGAAGAGVEAAGAGSGC